MDNKGSGDDPLSKLTDRQRAVIDAICEAYRNQNNHFLTALEIKDRFKVKETTARSYLTQIYKALNIEGEPNDKKIQLINLVCQQKEEPPQDLLSPLEAPPLEHSEREVQRNLEEEKLKKSQAEENRRQLESLSRHPEHPKPYISKPPPAGRLPRFTLWIALGVVGIIGVVVLILILGRNETDNQVGIAPSIDVALVDVTGTAQPLSQSDPFASEPTATLPPVASPSNTLQPTEIAQVVLTDTPEPANTITPAPTLSPTNTPTLIPLGIEDQFADGLSLDWEVLSGEPLILDQAYLTPGGNDLFIAIGDPRWTDYEIEIGIEAAISGTEHGNFIALRMTDDHLLALAFSGAGGRFWEYDATKWREVPGTVYGNGSLKGQTVRVVVEGNNVTAFVKGLQVKSITTMFPEGRVGLKIIKGSKITFFRVREIQP